MMEHLQLKLQKRMKKLKVRISTPNSNLKDQEITNNASANYSYKDYAKLKAPSSPSFDPIEDSPYTKG